MPSIHIRLLSSLRVFESRLCVTVVSAPPAGSDQDGPAASGDGVALPGDGAAGAGAGETQHRLLEAVGVCEGCWGGGGQLLSDPLGVPAACSAPLQSAHKSMKITSVQVNLGKH